MLDANQVELFCDVVAKLIVPLANHAGTEVAQRNPADEALVRQLRVAGGAINDALSQVARLTPPSPPPLPPRPDGTAFAQPATSTGS
jgi:hypothetical protein